MGKNVKKATGGFKTVPVVTTGELVLEIKMLFNMPTQQSPRGDDNKHYRIRAYSDYNGLPDRELGCTREIVGNLEPWDLEPTQNIRLGADGVLRLPTTSRSIHLKAEYVGVFPHSKVIGSCRISQDSSRINAFFKYKLFQRDGSAARCGIELQAIDGQLEQCEKMSDMTQGPVGPPAAFVGPFPGQETTVYSERSDALTVSGNVDITQASTPSTSYVGGTWSAVLNFFTWTCGSLVMTEDDI